MPYTSTKCQKDKGGNREPLNSCHKYVNINLLVESSAPPVTFKSMTPAKIRLWELFEYFGLM